MQFNVLVTYRKPNGKTLTRELSSCDYRVGHINSYGWEVIEIQVFYQGKYMQLETFERLRYQYDYERHKKKSIFSKFSKKNK